MITLDFIFALLISFGMSAILMAMTTTLTMVEVVQYVTYSSARAHAAGNLDPLSQEQAARKKYQLLTTKSPISSLFENEWFEISPSSAIEIRGGKHNNSSSAGSFKDEYPASDYNRPSFSGVRTTFTAKVLDIKLPIIGNTDPAQEGFASKIITIMIREPSQVECLEFMKNRFEKINTLDSRFSSYNQKSSAIAMEDNGC